MVGTERVTSLRLNLNGRAINPGFGLDIRRLYDKSPLPSHDSQVVPFSASVFWICIHRTGGIL